MLKNIFDDRKLVDETDDVQTWPLALRIFVLQRMYLLKAWNNTLIEGYHRNDFKFIKFSYLYFNTKVCY